MYLIRFLCVCFIFQVHLMGSSQSDAGHSEEVKNIKEKAEMLSGCIVNADYNCIANLYTKDAKIFAPGREIISGRENIKAYWVLPEGVRTTHHRLFPEEIHIYGSDAYDYGRYEGQTTRNDGTVSTWKGKYVVIWRKKDDDWKMYLDIWNRTED